MAPVSTPNISNDSVLGDCEQKKDKGGQSQPLTIKPGWNELDTIEGRPHWAGGRGEGNKGLNIEYTR